MAIGAKHAAATFNKPGFDIVNHKVYVFCGDGCLQEGISAEAASLAGHLKLDNLVLIYDDNNITIDGKTSLSFTENVPMRFRAYGWNTLEVTNGNTDFTAIEKAVRFAQTSKGKPTLISLKTIIGYGSTKQDTHGVHGSPLGHDVLADYKRKMGLNDNEKFSVSDNVKNVYAKVAKASQTKEDNWNKLFASYKEKYKTEAEEYERIFVKKALPSNWKDNIPKYTTESATKATRNYGGDVLNGIAAKLPELLGGSADLTPSNKTQLKCSHDFQGELQKVVTSVLVFENMVCLLFVMVFLSMVIFHSRLHF
eukprot:UN30661